MTYHEVMSGHHVDWPLGFTMQLGLSTNSNDRLAHITVYDVICHAAPVF